MHILKSSIDNQHKNIYYTQTTHFHKIKLNFNAVAYLAWRKGEFWRRRAAFDNT